MSKKNTTRASKLQSKLSKHLIAAVVLSTAIGILLAWIYRNQINPDGVSYIQVAHEYAFGRFRDAINGYWSPLLSWLLVPSVYIGIDPLFAYRVINFLLAMLIVIGVARLIDQHRLKPKFAFAVEQFSLLLAFGITLQYYAEMAAQRNLSIPLAKELCDTESLSSCISIYKVTTN